MNSEKWIYVTNDNLVTYKGQLFVIQVPSLSSSPNGDTITVECHHVGVNLEGKLNQAFGKTDLIGKTIQEIMTVILDGSGWILGDVDIPSTTKRGLVVDEQSIMANIKKVAELFDCGFIFDATLDYKKIHFKKASTDNLMVIREGVNMQALDVTIDKSALVTRLIVFGANDPVTNRPITVYGGTMKDEDGNIIFEADGVTPKLYDKTYIEDYSYYLDMGYDQSYIDAHPEYFLKESILNMSDYVDKTDLLFDAMRKLRELSKPKIDVSFDMADKIDVDALFLHTPEINEMVYVYSKKINDKLNISTTTGYNGKMFQLKVSEVKTNSDKPESVSITATNYSQMDGVVQTLISNAESVNRLIQTDGTISTNRLQGFIDVLSTKLNSSQSHWYTDDSGNMIFEDELGTKAMKLGGGIFGIADSKNPDGSWNWRTFGTGSGFTADMVNTGILSADLVQTGKLTSFDGSTWIDLDTGYFSFGGMINYGADGLKILLGQKTIEEYVADKMTHAIYVLPAQHSIQTDSDGYLKENTTLSMDISVFNGYTQVGATINSFKVKDSNGNNITDANITYSITHPTSTLAGTIIVTMTKNTILPTDNGTISFVVATTNPVKNYSYNVSWSKAKAGSEPYTVVIESSNGNTFKNGLINTVLNARVFKGSAEITSELAETRFKWTRTSSDTAGDTDWNNLHLGGSKAITVSQDDVRVRATFNCVISDN